MSVSLKVSLTSPAQGVEVRRVNLDKEVSTSFTFLQEKLCTIFPSLRRMNFTICWTDEEGDEVTMANDEDIITALTEMEGPVYKLNVKIKDMKLKDEKTEKEENTNNYDLGFHPGVICDGCEQSPLTGSRFKCLFCPDYDLCAQCENQGKHHEHPKIKLDPARKNRASKLRGDRPEYCFHPSADTLIKAFMGLPASGKGTPGSNNDQGKPNTAEEQQSSRSFAEALGINTEELNKSGKAFVSFLEAGQVENICETLVPLFGAIAGLLEEKVVGTTGDHVQDQEGTRTEVPEQNKSTDNTKQTKEKEIEIKTTNIASGDLNTTSKDNIEQIDVSPGNSDEHETIDPTMIESGKKEDHSSGDDWSIITESESQPEDQIEIEDKDKTKNEEKTRDHDPRVMVALEAMMNMGFNNQDGWLTTLLMAKNGDVGKVLDLIRPNKA